MNTTTRRPILAGAVALALCAQDAKAQVSGEFQGEWHGALDLGSQRLRLRLVVTAGPAAVLYSVDQGNAPIPVAATAIEGDQITLDIPVIGARFVGRLAGGRIEGLFTQGGTLPLVFSRETAATEAPPAEALTLARLSALRAGAGSPAFVGAAAKRGGRSIHFVDGLRAIGQPQTVGPNDRWHVGSITKSMTATLVARAVEARRVSWDDTVGEVLGAAVPDMREEYRAASLRHLLSHQSGLPANIEMAQLLAFPRDSADARADRIAYARLGLQQQPVGAMGANFTYSNTGYVIAGAMLEAKLGAPWEELISRHVFSPLRMTSAGQGAPGTPGAYDQPVGHALGATVVGETGASASLTPYPPGDAITDNPAALGPAGSVHASVQDMFKYLAAHRDRTSFLRRESWDTLHSPPFGGTYAMGWARRDGMLWHNGSNTLWYAEVMFDRTRGVIAMAATNDGRVGVVSQPIGAALVGAAQAVA
ncbi:MAG: beta-lactamase family protein [Hyphomonadaceae bacterium]|nr:beta-lactamase family protein [Hyphomonadaceae bacterium]MBX3511430.1 beta-lactamase family protein [Hyphomonadaceae bacterium]